MSWRALLNAVRNRIQSECGYDHKTCEVMVNGQPPPRCGKIFAAVHKGRRAAAGRGTAKTALDQVYGVEVTLSVRINEPFDRIGRNTLLDVETGMEDRVDAIIVALQADALQHVVVNAANVALAAATPDPPLGFCESLCYEDDTPPEVVGGTWFHADPKSQECGLKATIRFGRARRIQHPLAMS